MGNKKNEFWGSLKLKFKSLFLKIKEHRQEERVSLIFWERVTILVSEMHLCVPVETYQVRKVDLHFLHFREWSGTFANRCYFWITFLYHPNLGPILDQFAGVFPYPCVNATLFLPVCWNGPERTRTDQNGPERTRTDQYAIAPMAV